MNVKGGSCFLEITLMLTILLSQGLKARNFIHAKIEENIQRKLQESNSESRHTDALQQLIDSSKKSGHVLSMQVKQISSNP